MTGEHRIKLPKGQSFFLKEQYVISVNFYTGSINHHGRGSHTTLKVVDRTGH